MFTINVDPARAFMAAKIAGYWTIGEFEAFVARHREAAAALKALGGPTFGLIDGAQFAVQSQEVAAGLRAMVAGANFGDRHFAAVVVGSALARMQSQRVSGSEREKQFASKAEALSWLKAMGLPPEHAAAIARRA